MQFEKCRCRFFVKFPPEDTKILEFNQHQKPDQTLSIIHAYLEFMIKKIDECKNNFEALLTTTKDQNCGYLMSTTWIFDGTENKHDVCGGENCM